MSCLTLTLDPISHTQPSNRAYQEFVKAVIAYQKRLASATKVAKPLKKRRKVIVRSFSLARDIYCGGSNGINPSKESELKAGADFIESNTVLSQQQETRLTEAGVTMRNAFTYVEKLKMNEEREILGRKIMGKMTVEQLTDLLSFYHTMGQVCSEMLERKLHGIVIHELAPF